MSGILDNKSRVMDTIITQLGREQIASGELKICYVSFTDGTTFYKGDIVSGTQDPTQRVYLEASSLPQDQITLRADDAGKLLPFANTSGIQIKAGQFVDYVFNTVTGSVLTGSSDNTLFIKHDAFASLSDSLLASSVDNFNNLQTIGTLDKLFDDDGFGVGNPNIQFVINDTLPIPSSAKFFANVNNMDSLFNDAKLSNIDNFKFLPPINKINDKSIDKTDTAQTKGFQIGNYKPMGVTSPLSAKQIEKELSYYEKRGYMKVVNFEPTSNNNNLLAQFFEVTNDTMKKLDVISFGLVGKKRCFFVGKVMLDDNGTHTFIHLFTMMFGNS